VVERVWDRFPGLRLQPGSRAAENHTIRRPGLSTMGQLVSPCPRYKPCAGAGRDFQDPQPPRWFWEGWGVSKSKGSPE
jgi:hypothetical protein